MAVGTLVNKFQKRRVVGRRSSYELLERKVAISFTNDQLAAVNERAEQDGVSFAEAARRMMFGEALE